MPTTRFNSSTSILFTLFLFIFCHKFAFSADPSFNTFIFFNGCPDTPIITFDYSNDPDTLGVPPFYSYFGYSITLYVNYSQVYYAMYEWIEESPRFLLSSSLNMTNKNTNAIGYILNSNNVCESYQYNPTNRLLSAMSLAVYINGAKVDKQVSVGSTYQGIATPTSNTYLQITSTSPVEFSKTRIYFCNTSCSSTLNGTAHVPIGSAIFFINYGTSTTSLASSVMVGATGSTSFTYSCEDNDGGCVDYDDDWELNISINIGAILGIVFGTLGGCCLLFGLGYAFYRCRQRRSGPEISLLKV